MTNGDRTEVPRAYDWVTARSKCALEQVFNELAEVVDSDVKVVNTLAREGVSFRISRQATNKIIVLRERELNGARAHRTVVFELTQSGIMVTDKDRAGRETPLLVATPNMSKEGDCFLVVDGENLRLWQVSRKALENLFFDF